MSYASRHRIRPVSLSRLLPLLVCLLLPNAASAVSLSGQVIAVSDAYRIIFLTDDGRRLPVALIGVKLPDAADRKWREIGKRHLRMLLSGRFVTVDFTMRDKQGVILGEVRHGGADIGLRLLRSGLAVIRHDAALPATLKTQYLQAQEEARRRGMGIWQSPR
ncbi:MAG: thermonuclease family protein [Candidatus Thiodiazotropha sp.]